MAPFSSLVAGLFGTAGLFAPGPAIQDQDPACTSGGGFAFSCGYPGIWFNETKIGVYCFNDNAKIAAYNWTWLDLNKCLTNDYGALIPKTNGNYSDTCNNCSVTHHVDSTTVHMACNCVNGYGNYAPTSIDLNTIVYNTDGRMGCCMQPGYKTWKAPY